MANFTMDDYKKAIEIWRGENPDKKYLDISQRDIIEVKGIGKINFGSKMHLVRKIYNAMQEDKHYGRHKDLTDEEISWWTEQGMIWDYEKYQEECYQKAVTAWRKENPDKKYLDIPQTFGIEVKGIGKINLGSKISDVRKIYNAMQEGKHYGSHKDLTEEKIAWWTNQGMIWDYEKYKEECYQKAVIIWKEQNPDKKYLDFSARTDIEVEGIGKVNIGNRVYLVRYIYNAMQEGKHYGSHKDLTQEEINWWTNQGMIWDYEEYQKNNKTNSKPKSKSMFDKYSDMFDGDKSKADLVVKCLTDLKTKRKSKKKDDYNIENILQEFNVDIETLQKYLDRTTIKKTSEKSDPLMYQGMSLKNYCANNGYNYDVIYRAIKLHDFCGNDSLEQLINRSITIYERKGQKEPATWVYEKYGTLVKHILQYLCLDSTRILNDMTKYTISLEEAIRHTIFVQYKKESKYDYLEEVYNYLVEEIDSSKNEEKIIEDIVTKYQELALQYKFTKEEHEIVIGCFDKYLKTIKEYQKADVGLETNDERKIKKIKDYGLDEIDIEESFFIPLEFNNKVLLGRKSELYKRRQLLRQYIIDWDYYTDLEKENIILLNKFTEEEINMINKTRRDIDNTIKKIK